LDETRVFWECFDSDKIESFVEENAKELIVHFKNLKLYEKEG